MFLFSLIIEEIRLYIYKFYFKNKLEKSLRKLYSNYNPFRFRLMFNE